MIGEIISNYKVLSIIGEGGMGMVYLAEHISIGRKAAIKALHKKYLSNTNIKERFKNEAATLSQIEHPNIVKLYDYIENDKGLFLIMEYVDGVLLDEYIKKESGPINEQNAIKIMKGLLAGFAYAHSKNIVHRDVKPNNVIISRDFRTIKILDFGIAKILDDNSRHFTKDGTQMGTVYYMSPEQVRGQTVDKRSDIYSLGVSFFQMITGTNPYEKITTEFEIYNKITQEDLPPAQAIYPYASKRIDKIVRKATQKNPNDRYQNCEQILAELKDNTNSIPVEESKVPQRTYIEQPIYEPAKEGGVSTGLIFTLVVLIICIAAYLFYTINRNIKEEPSTEIATEVTTEAIPDTAVTYIKTDTLPTVPKENIENNIPPNNERSYKDDVFEFTDGLNIDGPANGYREVKYIDPVSSGEVYKGEFLNNMKHGNGTYIWPNGSYYKGEFRNNKRNGCGTYFDISTGKSTYGKFKNDNYIGDC